MERRLNLIKNDGLQELKRVFPRFPFTYMTFKADQDSHVFEVKDISYSGMQLKCSNFNHDWDETEIIKGVIHWQGQQMSLEGRVKWKTRSRLGLEFIKRGTLAENITSFLSFENIAQKLKPLHQMDFAVEIPAKLKYWIRSDGPVEIFVWQHADRELSEFQLVYFDQFIEWRDGVGIKTGKVLSKRNIDTPLITEDEVLFQVDAQINASVIGNFLELMDFIPSSYWSEDTADFLKRKLKLPSTKS